MNVPYSDLPKQYQSLSTEIDAAIKRVLESGTFVLGPESKLFEQEFAAFSHAPFAVGVDSGTSALHLALLAAGIRPGDEVITVPMTFAATVAAIEYAGAITRLVDIDPVHRTLDPAQLEAAITPKTRALIPVHLHGQACDMSALLEIANRHGLVVIEDAAQAHGGTYRGNPLGTFGRLGCFSFYPGKNLGAYGEAGLVLCANSHDAQQIELLRNWGSQHRYHHEQRGFNHRIDALQCAVLRVKLRHLAAWTTRRRELAALYFQLLKDAPLRLPVPRSDAEHAYHVFAVDVPQRDQVTQRLLDLGIQTSSHYPIPVHLQPAYRDLGYASGAFPVSEKMAAETLSLPIYPEMTNAAVEYVASSLKNILAAG